MIVCPSSLVNNWGREFDKWLGRERLQVFKVDKEHTVGQFASSKVCPVMVISYELFLRNAKAIAKLPLVGWPGSFNLRSCRSAAAW